MGPAVQALAFRGSAIIPAKSPVARAGSSIQGRAQLLPLSSHVWRTGLVPGLACAPLGTVAADPPGTWPLWRRLLVRSIQLAAPCCPPAGLGSQPACKLGSTDRPWRPAATDAPGALCRPAWIAGFCLGLSGNLGCLCSLGSTCRPQRYRAWPLGGALAAADAARALCRLAWIAGFCLGPFGGNERTWKPFNPILGETFEVERPNGVRFLAEQVRLSAAPRSHTFCQSELERPLYVGFLAEQVRLCGMAARRPAGLWGQQAARHVQLALFGRLALITSVGWASMLRVTARVSGRCVKPAQCKARCGRASWPMPTCALCQQKLPGAARCGQVRATAAQYAHTDACQAPSAMRACRCRTTRPLRPHTRRTGCGRTTSCPPPPRASWATAWRSSPLVRHLCAMLCPRHSRKVLASPAPAAP